MESSQIWLEILFRREDFSFDYIHRWHSVVVIVIFVVHHTLASYYTYDYGVCVWVVFYPENNWPDPHE